MKRKFIPAEESFRQWKKDPKYVAEYEALEKEFALASALIEARSKVTPIHDSRSNEAQVAVRLMGSSTQEDPKYVARLESGKVLPSTRTLERFARATRTRLRISFESSPEPAALKR